MRKFLSLLVCFGFHTAAHAGQETGKVTFQHGQYQSNAKSAGYTFFFLDNGVKVEKPSCATNGDGERWVINNDWPAAKAQLSVLLAAFTTGKNVLVRGSGNCDVWGDTETALDIVVVP